MSGGGKVSARQKMINMMYLVLMAMLALNVSKEILVAFGRVNDSIEATSNQVNKGTNLLYSGLNEKAQSNPEKYGNKNKTAASIKGSVNKALVAVDSILSMVERSVGGVDPETGELPWKSMDGTNLDEILFPGGSLKAGKGQYLTDAVTNFKVDLLSALKEAKATKGVLEMSDEAYQVMIADLEKTLSTDPYQKGKGAPKEAWVKHKFEHYPAAAGVAFLKQIKADIRNAEFRSIRKIAVQGQGIVVNKMEALPISKATTVMKGGKFEALLRVAAYDSTSVPEMFIWTTDKNGKKIGKEKQIKVEGGAGIVSIPASSIGNKYWGGIIKVKDDDDKVTEYPFTGEYGVTQPAVVVSAEKMNVLFRGVSNPMSVSVPGVSSSKVSVSASGASIRSLGGGRYAFDVTKTKGRTISIRVTAEMPDGSKQTFPGKVYRVKGLPDPVAMMAKSQEPKLPKSNIKALTVDAVFKDFDFDLKLRVKSFVLKVPGKPSIKVAGNRMNTKAKKAIDRARGEVYIRDIKASIVGKSSYRLGRVSPMTIKIL